MKGRRKLFAVVIFTGSLCMILYLTRLHPAVNINPPDGNNIEVKVATVFENPLPKVHLPPVVQKDSPKFNPTTRAPDTNIINVAAASTEIHYEYKGRVLHVNDKLKVEIVSAHFDFRQNRKRIAILGCHHHLHAGGVKYYCMVKYPDGTEKCLSRETSQEPLSSPDENGSKTCRSTRYDCTLDAASDDDLPVSVALSTSPNCDPRTDWLMIFDSRFESYKTGSSPVEERNIGVCYQTPLFHAENLQKEFVIESIERNKAMGAEWFTIYFRENPSKEVMQVLKQYENEGVLEVINMTVSDATYYDIRYYGELLAIRDCIYRNMYRVKYLSMTDLDEVFVPQNSAHKNWNDLLKAIDSNHIGSFQFKHVALMIPPGTTTNNFNHVCSGSGRKIATPVFLTRVYRTQPFPIPKVRVGRWKVIVKPQCVDKVGIHTVYGMMSGYSQSSVPIDTGILFHYRVPDFINVDECTGCHVDNRFIDLTPGLVEKFIRRVCK